MAKLEMRYDVKESQGLREGQGLQLLSGGLGVVLGL